MIKRKEEIGFDKHIFTTHYYEIDTLTDFEYLIILMTIEAFENNDELSNVITKFTKGDNDVNKLMCKRFESLFKIGIREFRSVIEDAKAMEKETKRLKPASSSLDIGYNETFDKYLLDEKFVSEDELRNELERRINTNNSLVFNKINKIETEEILMFKIFVELSNDFKMFDILNLKNQTDEEIIERTIEGLKEETKQYLSISFDNISVLDNFEERFSSVSRHYGESSIFTTIGEYGEIVPDTLFEFDQTKNDCFILTKLALYKGVPLSTEKRYSFENFRSETEYSLLLHFMFNNKDKLSNSYIEKFIINANTNDELRLISELNLYQTNSRRSFEKIEEMINCNINIINDDVVVMTEFFEYQVKNNNRISLYKFLDQFYSDDKFNSIAQNKKVDLLYAVFDHDSSLLSEKDYEYITKLIEETNYVRDAINQGIADIAGLRAAVDSKLTEVKATIKNLDDEQIEELDSLSELEITLGNYKRLTNFFVHIKDDGKKNFKADNEVAAKFDKRLPQLKEEIKAAAKAKYMNEPLDSEYIKLLKELENKLRKGIE